MDKPSEKNYKFIAVAGNIGAGKSALTGLLAKHFGWEAFYESVENNPYLSDFYEDMRRWSFNLQVHFLSSRFKHHKEMVAKPASLIQDRTIYEDAEIFAKNLHDMSLMSAREYENTIRIDYLERLNKLYEDWIDRYPHEKLIIDTDDLDFVTSQEDLGTI